MTRSIFAFSLLLALPPATAAQDRSVQYRTPQGELTIRYGPPLPVPAGPAPAFAVLDRDGDRAIGPGEATAYPLLADDFLYADANRNGRVSKAEYARWTARP
jgi:hypothetical protein